MADTAYFCRNWPKRKVADSRIKYKNRVYYHPNMHGHDYVFVDDYGELRIQLVALDGTSLTVRAIMPEDTPRF